LEKVSLALERDTYNRNSEKNGGSMDKIRSSIIAGIILIFFTLNSVFATGLNKTMTLDKPQRLASNVDNDVARRLMPNKTINSHVSTILSKQNKVIVSNKTINSHVSTILSTQNKVIVFTLLCYWGHQNNIIDRLDEIVIRYRMSKRKFRYGRPKETPEIIYDENLDKIEVDDFGFPIKKPREKEVDEPLL